jgi:ATP-dependent DNA helicase RecG
MNIDQIKILATQGESQQLEYKKSTANLKNILKTICAFLNGDGESVLIGVEAHGHLQEVQQPKNGVLRNNVTTQPRKSLRHSFMLKMSYYPH